MKRRPNPVQVKTDAGTAPFIPIRTKGKEKGFYVSPEYIGPYRIVKDCLEGFVVLGCHGRMVSLLDIKSSGFSQPQPVS
jgi:hypothetical protein